MTADYTIVFQALIAGAVTLILAYMQHRSAAMLRKEMVDANAAASLKSQETQAAVEVIAAKVEEVHIATNSLTDRLVQSTEKEALVRGGVEERARADVRADERHEVRVEAKQASVDKRAELELKKDIAAVPEKTAKKVVDKMQDKTSPDITLHQ